MYFADLFDLCFTYFRQNILSACARLNFSSVWPDLKWKKVLKMPKIGNRTNLEIWLQCLRQTLSWHPMNVFRQILFDMRNLKGKREFWKIIDFREIGNIFGILKTQDGNSGQVEQMPSLIKLFLSEIKLKLNENGRETNQTKY